MPDTPQHPSPDIYTVLGELRQAMANAAQMTSFALELKVSADRLLPIVGDELRKVKRALDQALPLLPMALLVLLGTGCAVDVNRLVKDLQRPSITYANRAAWRCDGEATRVPNKRGTVEACTPCQNISREVQAVTINDKEQSIAAGGKVLLCETQIVTDGR